MEKLAYPWVEPVLARLPSTPAALPRALLLGGPAGLGKRTTGLFLARAILCEAERAQLGACGNCAACHLVAAGSHPDLRQVEIGQDEDTIGESGEEGQSSAKKPARQISVDRIRTLGEFVSTSAHRGLAKVILIAPAEAMHPSAANAVLKILEEPPGKTHFLLVSHKPERLLPTIRSRCFQVAFIPPSATSAVDWLKGQGVEHPALALTQGGYAPLAATELAATPEFWAQRKALLEALARPGFNPVSAADQAEPIEGPMVATLLSQWAYDLVSLKSGGGVRYHTDFQPVLEKLASRVSGQATLAWYDDVIQFGRVAQHPLNKRLAMESLLSSYPGN